MGLSLVCLSVIKFSVSQSVNLSVKQIVFFLDICTFSSSVCLSVFVVLKQVNRPVCLFGRLLSHRRTKMSDFKKLVYFPV